MTGQGWAFLVHVAGTTYAHFCNAKVRRAVLSHRLLWFTVTQTFILLHHFNLYTSSDRKKTTTMLSDEVNDTVYKPSLYNIIRQNNLRIRHWRYSGLSVNQWPSIVRKTMRKIRQNYSRSYFPVSLYSWKYSFQVNKRVRLLQIKQNSVTHHASNYFSKQLMRLQIRPIILKPMTTITELRCRFQVKQYRTNFNRK